MYAYSRKQNKIEVLIILLIKPLKPTLKGIYQIRKIKGLRPAARCAIFEIGKGKAREAAYPQIITITVLHSRSLLAVVGGYFFLLKIS